MGLVLLIVACVGTFAAMTVRTRGQQLLGFSAETLEDWGGVTSGAGRTEPWRLLASAFVHVTGFHLLYNVGALTILAFLWSGFTSITYAVLCFLICASVATLGSLYWNGRRRKTVTAVGASGGICGLNAALIAFAACRGETDLRNGLAIVLALTLVVGLSPASTTWLTSWARAEGSSSGSSRSRSATTLQSIRAPFRGIPLCSSVSA